MSALERIIRARSILLQDAPFFGVLALNLATVERAECETMATDGASLFYNPEFVATLSDSELLFVVAHEALHCALSHMSRIGERDLKEFNIAADYAINWELSRMPRGVGTMPKGGLLDAQYADMSAEEIYAARQAAKRQEKAKQAAQGQQGGQGQQGAPASSQGAPGQQPGTAGQEGQPGASQAATGAPGQAQGQGAPSQSGNGKPGAHGGTFGGILKPGDGSAAAADAMADKWQTITRQAVAVAGKQPGSVPGMLANVLAELNRPASIDYRAEFRDFIDSRVVTDYSFTRPNRRFLGAGLVLPGATIDGIEHLVFAVDTSGSIDAHMLENAAAEIIGALDDGKVQRLTIVWADTHVQHVQEFERGDDIEGHLQARGGGGTRFDHALQWVADHAPDATAIVYLTDAECRHWGTEPDCPILWAIHGKAADYERLAARAPFGRTGYVGMLD